MNLFIIRQIRTIRVWEEQNMYYNPLIQLIQSLNVWILVLKCLNHEHVYSVKSFKIHSLASVNFMFFSLDVIYLLILSFSDIISCNVLKSNSSFSFLLHWLCLPLSLYYLCLEKSLTKPEDLTYPVLYFWPVSLPSMYSGYNKHHITYIHTYTLVPSVLIPI